MKSMPKKLHERPENAKHEFPIWKLKEWLNTSQAKQKSLRAIAVEARLQYSIMWRGRSVETNGMTRLSLYGVICGLQS